MAQYAALKLETIIHQALCSRANFNFARSDSNYGLSIHTTTEPSLFVRHHPLAATS